jgi:hypothetical protein
LVSETYDAVALFSGGLDSILAVKVVEEQGRRVKCLHFLSPFFGKPHKIEHWSTIYGLDIVGVDVGEDFVRMLENPAHGYGRFLNPCIDCKILMAAKARELMDAYGARCIISGEVLGQRPMSQRRDALNIIRRDAQVKDVLVRPLSAKRLDPTQAEIDGVLDRERLLTLSGRGRKDQMGLARKYGLKEIPTPAGGCMLAEQESARRYKPLIDLANAEAPELRASLKPADFDLSNMGRQYWSGTHWLVIGRNKADNERLTAMAEPEDYLFKVRFFPGPISLGRPLAAAQVERGWSEEALRTAAALAAWFSPKARAEGAVRVLATRRGETQEFEVTPAQNGGGAWGETVWEGSVEKNQA